MEQKISIENFHNELVDVIKEYTETNWYELFLTLLYNCQNEEMDNLHTRILNSLNDAFAISSVKKKYENNETHKRIW